MFELCFSKFSVSNWEVYWNISNLIIHEKCFSAYCSFCIYITVPVKEESGGMNKATLKTFLYCIHHFLFLPTNIASIKVEYIDRL